MADIFISYSRTDKPRVAPLVAALEAKGWSIWWDMDLAPGEEFDDVTAAALESARSVIVIWTPTSVASRWVRGEARVGADRNVLVPVRFEAVNPPIDMRAIQTTDMDEWGGDPQSTPFQLLQQSLIAMLGEPSATGLPCVGRAKELERARELVERTKRGDGGFVLFSGEAGVGKTRMTLEMERLARDADFVVLRGHCADMESAPPYKPVLEQIEQVARAMTPEAMRVSLGENATELSKLMPELRQQYNDIPPYPTLPPEQERRYLLHGLSEFIARNARGRPLMLVYEDLHWADESTCIFLRHAAERLKGEPVLLVGAYRDSDLSSGAPFGRVLQQLIRERLAEDLPLKRLMPAEIVDMLVRQYGAEPPATLVELIFSKTEGNPFFVEEVLRHLNEVGKLLTETGKFREGIEAADTEVTRGVRLIIEDRIGEAGTHFREVLTIAAVAGRTFPFDLLVKVDSKHDEDDILDIIEEAERKRIIEDVSQDRVARYRFVHEQVREALVSALSLPRVQRLHLRIADALEAMAGANPEKLAGEIGYHLYQAGGVADGARTAHYLTVAGERAMASLAFEDALRQFDLAANVQKDQGEASARARLQSLRADALRGAERFPEALEALGQAVALASTQEAKDELTLRRCWLLLDIWRGIEAIDDLEQLSARARDRADAKWELNVQRALARGYYVMSLDHTGFAEKCKDAYERAIELARAQNDKKALGESLVAIAQLVDYWPAFAAQARANLVEALIIARETADEELEIDVATKRMGLVIAGEAPVDQEAVLKRLIARRDPIRLNALYFRMMWSTLGQGRLERCVEICDAGIELAYRIGTQPVQYPTIKALAQLHLGQFDKAWASLEQEVADAAHPFGAALRDMGKLHYEIEVGAYEAALSRAPHVIAESHALARAWMLRSISVTLASVAAHYPQDESTLARLDALIGSTTISPSAAGRAALAYARGDTSAARALREGAASERDPNFAGQVALLHLRARACAADAEWAGAYKSIATAVAMARASKAKGQLWRLLGEQALIETALNMPDAAGASRDEARALHAELAVRITNADYRAAFLGGRLAERLALT